MNDLPEAAVPLEGTRPVNEGIAKCTLPGRLPSTVAVVVPTRGGYGRIEPQLEALARQDFPGSLEVIVSNNDGDPRLDNWLAAEAKRLGLGDVLLVDSSTSPGVSGARNAGCSHATAELLLICDDDDVVADDWVTKMVAASPAAHVLCGRLVPFALGDGKSGMKYRSARLGAGLPEAMPGVRYAAGANCAVWRTAWDELGGWSTEFRGGGDDMDFSIRAQLRGYTLSFVNDAVVHYAVRTGFRETCRQQFHYGAGAARMLDRHHGSLALDPPDPRVRTLLKDSFETLGYLRPPPRPRRWLARMSHVLGSHVEARRLRHRTLVLREDPE